MNYKVWIDNQLIGIIHGEEAAWEAYERANALAEMFGKIASLSTLDGEVIANSMLGDE